MKIEFMKKLFALLFAFVPFLSFAHPGHGDTEGFTIIHYVVEPIHVITLAVVGVAVYIYYKHMMRRTKKA